MPPPTQPPSSHNVLARYGNFYHGDDDLFAHCLILRNGHCIRLFQGLTVVTATYDRAPDAEHDQLVGLLAAGIPAGWTPASYDANGYNFITDAMGPNANEIAVFGVEAGASGPPGQYYVPPAGSQVADLVKTIAAVD
jgi:hypothetical protein